MRKACLFSEEALRRGFHQALERDTGGLNLSGDYLWSPCLFQDRVSAEHYPGVTGEDSDL